MCKDDLFELLPVAFQSQVSLFFLAYIYSTLNNWLIHNIQAYVWQEYSNTCTHGLTFETVSSSICHFFMMEAPSILFGILYITIGYRPQLSASEPPSSVKLGQSLLITAQ